MSRSMLALASLAAAIALSVSGSTQAADLGLPEATVQAPVQACGSPCGCLSVRYDYHRELRSTYGTAFDPRNYDTTQPHYYFGPVRAYPRYFVSGVPAEGQC